MNPNAQALVPGNGSNPPNNGNCHGCGKPGHYIKDCPERKKQGRSNRNGGRGGGRRPSNNGGNNRNGRARHPFVPPNSNNNNDKQVGTKDGKPVWQRTIFGEPYRWCHKSQRWNKQGSGGDGGSHQANAAKRPQRRPKKGKKKTTKPQPRGNLALIPDPSFWLAQVSQDDDDYLESCNYDLLSDEANPTPPSDVQRQPKSNWLLDEIKCRIHDASTTDLISGLVVIFAL